MIGSGLRRGFARRAPGKEHPIAHVDIRVTNMTWADVSWWDRNIGIHHAANPSRADRFWVWSVILPLCHLIQRRKRRYCRPLVVWVRTDNRRFVRAGMSIVIEDYPHVDVSDPGQSEFLWFMSVADSAVLQYRFGVSNPPSLGRVLIDCGIVLSQNAGFWGRVGLHAARAGARRLVEFYVKSGLVNLAESARLPRAVPRRNDGRFFYAGPDVAESLARVLDPDR